MAEEMGLDELLVIVLQQNLLGSLSADERAEGLGILMEKVSVTYGAAGSNLGHLLRASGVPVPLTALLSDADLAMRNQALWIIGNLCSDSVDVDSALTKQALMAAGADKVLFGCLDEELTVELACAALQNLCHDARWAEQTVRLGAVARLSELAAHGSEQTKKYAAGALRNMQVRLLELPPEQLKALTPKDDKPKPMFSRESPLDQARALALLLRT